MEEANIQMKTQK